MWFVSTIFDESYKPPATPRPVVSVLYDSKTKTIRKLDLFRPGSTDSLYQIKKRLEIIDKIVVSGQPLSINDAKYHLDALSSLGIDTPFDEPYRIYSRIERIPFDRTASPEVLFDTCKRSIIAAAKVADTKPLWQRLHGRASLVYSQLQRRGFWDGIQSNYPFYTMNSFSGRPSAVGYTIFNQPADAIIEPVERTHTRFIHFDWIAADFRAASILSGDEVMLEAFKESDPYTKLAQALQLSRAECKQGLFTGTYRLDPDNQMVKYYNRFSTWMLEQVDFLHENGYLQSLLGRRFRYKSGILPEDPKERDTQDKRIFNAVLQGTVAHAMQNVVWLTYHHLGNHFLTDRFDSIIMTADESTVDLVIKHVGEIMFKPFSHVFEDGAPESLQDITFPVAISVGSQWGQWERVKEIR